MRCSDTIGTKDILGGEISASEGKRRENRQSDQKPRPDMARAIFYM